MNRKEAFAKAILEGVKIRGEKWPKGLFINFSNLYASFYWGHQDKDVGGIYSPHPEESNEGWEVYEEPKKEERVVKCEKCIAGFPIIKNLDITYQKANYCHICGYKIGR